MQSIVLWVGFRVKTGMSGVLIGVKGRMYRGLTRKKSARLSRLFGMQSVMRRVRILMEENVFIQEILQETRQVHIGGQMKRVLRFILSSLKLFILRLLRRMKRRVQGVGGCVKTIVTFGLPTFK